MKKNTKKYQIILLLLVVVLAQRCIEPYEVESQTFENALVIEATITNELKNQVVKLSRSFKLEDTLAVQEKNATVLIRDNNQNEYQFNEVRDGYYVSQNQFQAVPDVQYQLFVTTSDNKLYESKPIQILGKSNLESMSVSKDMNEEQKEFFNIKINSFDPNRTSNYYRYTFEETYEVRAPYWSPFKAIVISENPPIVNITTKTEENKICWNTIQSNEIILNETTGLSEDRVSDFIIRKIPVDDFSVSYRYSILVKQYVMSLEAHTFYKTLSKFSNSESLLSQNQPGFFSGNVYSVANQDEKVLGFFDVSYVSSKRMFFNYRDFFENGRPPNIVDCLPLVAPELPIGETGESDLVVALNSNQWMFYDYNYNQDPDFLPGPFVLVKKDCGDCTTNGSNIKPNFWID